MYTLNCKGKLLETNNPLVMGIINCTPDSFFEGHLHKPVEEITGMASKMLREGANILDVGGQSTKPNSQRVSADEELSRVLPIIEAILEKHEDAILSIDTYHSEVAKSAVKAGVSIVNDISAGNMDPLMLSTVAELRVPYVCMHMQGTPDNMQRAPVYQDVTTEIIDFFIEKVAVCRHAGIEDIIVDPGFGFGKTIQHNFELLKNLRDFKIFDLPILVGISRKSTIYKTLDITVAEALNGTTVLNTIALMNGASILRVHDVKAARETVNLWAAYHKV